MSSMSPEELLGLPVSVDLVTAGRAHGIGRTKAYELAQTGEFPCPVLRLGNTYRTTRADLLRSLGVDPDISRHATPDQATVNAIIRLGVNAATNHRISTGAADWGNRPPAEWAFTGIREAIRYLVSEGLIELPGDIDARLATRESAKRPRAKD